MSRNKKIQHRDTSFSASSFSREGRKGAFYIVLLALLLLFALYTGLKFPYTYITMEGDNFWVLTWDFWQQKLATLPAFTNWLADFLMQFYSHVWVGVCIHTLVLGLVGVLAHAVLKDFTLKGKLGGWVAWLALLPPVLLGFYCTFNLSFQLQCLFFFGLLKVFLLIPNMKGKFFFSLACVPVGYMLMCLPLLALLLMIHYFLAYISDKYRIIWNCPLICLVVTPLLYSEQVSFIPFEKRFTYMGCNASPLTNRYTQNGEYIKKLVCLSNEQRWEDLLYKEHIRSDAQRGNGIALRYALLAESALGTLPENLLDYPITEENQFLYPHLTDYVAIQFNRLFYLNLGIFDEAFHHAQEYSNLMPNGSNFSSLRQLIDYSIEEGEWEITEKFLTVLSHSSCHKNFIKERRAMMEKAKQHFNKKIDLRADNFVGGYPLPVEMLRLERYYKDSPNRKKMIDYAICSYILRGDFNSFMIAINAFDIYKDKELPKAYSIFKDSFK